MLDKVNSVFVLSLCAFIVSLPLFEAPKTVFLCILLVFGLILIWLNKVKLELDDGFILAFIVSGYVVALFSGVHHEEWRGSTGLALIGLLLLTIKKISISDPNRRRISMMVLLSTLIATLHGFWLLFVTHKLNALELNSVGHVNHSSIYLVESFAFNLALAMTLKRADSLAFKLFTLCCLVVTAVAVMISDSRASAMTLALIAFLISMSFFKKSKWPIVLVFVATAVSLGYMYASKASIIQKHIDQTATGPYVGPRQMVWNSALLIWRQYPIFGIGIRNYSRATKDIQAQWLEKEGKHFSDQDYLPISHAHNLYLNTLAERGVFGFFVLMAMLLRISILIYKHRPTEKDNDIYWASWCAALGVLGVVFGNGLFNTTLHSEHGMLAVLLIGLWWSSVGQRQDPLTNAS